MGIYEQFQTIVYDPVSGGIVKFCRINTSNPVRNWTSWYRVGQLAVICFFICTRVRP